MSQITITLLFLLFAIVMFMWEKIPLGLTSMIVCVGLVVTGVLEWQTAFAGFIDSNVILFVAMFIVGGALFETGMANNLEREYPDFAAIPITTGIRIAAVPVFERNPLITPTITIIATISCLWRVEVLIIILR